MPAPRLRSPITAYELHEALSALDVRPAAALRDPVRAMRYIASADLSAANRFLRIVLLPADVVDLTAYENEDEARLFAAAVMARVLVLARECRKDRLPAADTVPGNVNT